MRAAERGTGRVTAGIGAVQTIEVAEIEAGSRLDRWFKRRYPGLGHGRIEKLLRTGQIRVDGKRVKAGLRLAAGMRIRVPPIEDAPTAARKPPRAREPSRADAAKLRALVLYKDDDVIAIDKPPGLAVQGGTKTLIHLDAMLDALRFGSDERPRRVDGLRWRFSSRRGRRQGRRATAPRRSSGDSS